MGRADARTARVLCVLLAALWCLLAGVRAASSSSRSTGTGRTATTHATTGGQSSSPRRPPSSASVSRSAAERVDTHLPTMTTASFVNASTGLSPRPTAQPVIAPSDAPYALHDSVLVRSDLQLANTDGLFFTFNASENVPIYVSLSLCSGPTIAPYNTSNTTLLSELHMNADTARTATLVSMYVSDNAREQRPSARSDLDADHIGFAQGGWTQVALPKGVRSGGVWIGLFPPTDARGRTGAFRVQIAASTKAEMEAVADHPGVYVDDTDRESALLTSFNYTSPAPNISLIVLPTAGEFSLSSLTYFNSSFCAIWDTWDDVNDSPLAPRVNSSETSRNTVNVVTRKQLYIDELRKHSAPAQPSINDTAGQPQPGAPPPGAQQPAAADDVAGAHSLRAASALARRANDTNHRDQRPPQVRMQFYVAGLGAGLNYTAYLVASQVVNGILTRTLYPSVKFVTKTNPYCRLVYDLSFCPELAYSIPSNPSVPPNYAMSVIENMISANYGNFSAMLATFPCESETFGMYSSVTTCTDCMRAYQNWLCAVAIPRCTDLVDPAQSAASQNGTDLEGLAMPANVQLYPYVVNRIGEDSSRQSYINELLRPGDYGELLPCLSTCEMVTRSCPPVIQWMCPQWTVTAQRDYGTFADADSDGFGAGGNGGAGKNGLRFGGTPSRYVAQDAFGHVYCNAMDVDRLLRQADGAARMRYSRAVLLVPVALAVFLGGGGGLGV
ncbi:stretch-activated cation channel mid1 [Malassezia sp. CBS 17886]|nr:stretch-activated cation channel mid1 [Malassezia sp. CBS 17886]